MSLFQQANQAAQATPKPTVANLVTTAQAAREARIAATKALAVAPFDIPGLAPTTDPEHPTLMPHQYAGIAAALPSIAEFGGVLLGDDMGLGKTREALAIGALYKGNGYIVVVAPPANLGGYRNEVEAAFPGWRFFHAHGRTAGRIPAGTDVVFLSDDPLTMRSWLAAGEQVINGKPTLVPSRLVLDAAMFVRDEIHRDKGTASAKHSKRSAISMMVGQVMRDAGKPVVTMTGTLLVNKPIDGFYPLQITGGAKLVMAVTPGARTVNHYLYRYCIGDGKSKAQGGYGVTYNGVHHVQDLHENLRATCYVRREKAWLDPSILPGFGWVVSPLALPHATMTKVRRAEQDVLDLILEEQGVDAMWRAKKAEALVRIGRLRKECGVAKAAAVVDFLLHGDDDNGVEAPLANGGQAIVFYDHEAVWEALVRELLRNRVTCSSINGRTSNRAQVEADFQGGKVQVVLAQLQAAGQALTLTAARCAVWAQLPWSYGMLAQQAGRNRRIDKVSQDRAARGEQVEYHVILAAHDDGKSTIDAAVWDVLRKKGEVCDAVNNGGENAAVDDDSVTFQALTEWFSHR